MTGQSAIRQTVRMFGNVQIIAVPASTQRLENDFCQCLESLEDAVTRDRD